jgi:hypothetical protein
MSVLAATFGLVRAFLALAFRRAGRFAGGFLALTLIWAVTLVGAARAAALARRQARGQADAADPGGVSLLGSA